MAQPVQITTPVAGIQAGFSDVPVSPSNPLSVSQVPLQGTFVDRSGSIASGGVSQTLAVANTSRRRLFIMNPATATSQNIATAESLFVNFGTAAALNSTSMEITPGGSYDSEAGPVTTQSITVISTTAGHLFVAKEM